MNDSILTMTLAGAGLFALAMLIQAGLSGWRGSPDPRTPT